MNAFEESIKKITEFQERLKTLPWCVGFRDRGMGHGDHCVMVEEDIEVPEHLKHLKIIAKVESLDMAHHLVQIQKEHLERSKG